MSQDGRINTQSRAPAAKAWRCSACGYIHRGDGPPEECPVCGAPKAEFEPYEDTVAGAPAASVRRWRCLNCTYVHAGDRPPEACTVCGAHADRFEPLPEAVMPAEGGTAVGRVVILGGGIAGISAIESLRQAAPRAEIALVTRETGLPYYRLNLTRFLAGEIGADDLPIHPRSWYDDQRVELLAGVEAADLALGDSVVVLADGKRLPFDRLILTAGAHPFVPPFSGTQLEGVTALRTQADADRILAAVQSEASCVVVGGGILGLETAGGIARRGARVTLLESHEWLMPRQLNRRAGELLATWIMQIGIELRTQAVTEELFGQKHVTGIRLKSGDSLPADLVILAAGVRPNSHLARRSGLEVGQGVIVDDHLWTSRPNILAAGDIAEHRGVLYGNWSAAQYQGSIAGMNAAGAKVEFGGIPRSNTLKVLGLDLVSIGKFEPEDGSYQVVEQEQDGRYARFVFRDNRLTGAILMGDASLAAALKKAVEGEKDCSALLRGQPSAAGICEFMGQQL